MKFICNTEFVHSGVRQYTENKVYDDITAKVAEQLIALDKKKPLGALSFFTPADEEAVKFVKDKMDKLPKNTGAATTTPSA